jgi:hypothetical protein
VYILLKEKSETVANLWDGVGLKRTFRKCCDIRLMDIWLEIVQLALVIMRML